MDLGAAGSPGPGGVTLANPPGITACFNVGAGTGGIAAPITLSGDSSGCALIVYEGETGENYTLASPIQFSTQGLCVDVVEGSNTPDTGGVLHLTGTLTDGAGSHSLTKIGDGTLTLAPGNSHTGTLVERGVLKVTADSALGDPAGMLTVNGGCFQAGSTFALTRPLVFGPNGGCVRVDEQGTRDVLTIPALTWSNAQHGFFSGGQAILSGTTVAGLGSLAIGAQTVYADAAPTTFNEGHFILSLRGTAALPAGNLSILNESVLELGNGDFTRTLGTGAGQVQLPTQLGAGWAAHGANRIVNIGGAGAPLVWGSNSASAPFLGLPGGSINSVGSLILGSSSATHRVDFQNPLEIFNGGTNFFVREIQVPDGPAAVEARLSGNITYSNPNVFDDVELRFTVSGVLEVPAGLTGRINLTHGSLGTVIFSGTNTLDGSVIVQSGGKFAFTSNAAAGSPASMAIGPGSEIDGSGMGSPFLFEDNEYTGIEGTLRASLTTTGYLEGNGLITGNLIVNPGTTGSGSIRPRTGGTPFRVGGHFTLNSGAVYDAEIHGPPAGVEYPQISVTGNVTLGGYLDLDFDASSGVGETYYLLLNGGTDPISGNFDGLPEGATLTMFDGTILTATYTANGDGGPTGNDFALVVSYVPPPPPSDEITIVNVTRNPATGQLSMTIVADIGHDYVLEVSEDLENWVVVESFTGDGTNHTFTSPPPVGTRQFLRVGRDTGVAAAAR